MAFAVNDRWPGFWGGHGLFLLLCPLARSPLRAQPPQGAKMLRDRRAKSAALSRTVVAANLKPGFPPPPALGGYRPWRCQVVKKARQLGLNAEDNLHQHGRRKARQPPPIQPHFVDRRDDRALALLSTARSERSA